MSKSIEPRRGIEEENIASGVCCAQRKNRNANDFPKIHCVCVFNCDTLNSARWMVDSTGCKWGCRKRFILHPYRWHRETNPSNNTKLNLTNTKIRCVNRLKHENELNKRKESIQLWMKKIRIYFKTYHKQMRVIFCVTSHENSKIDKELVS